MQKTLTYDDVAQFQAAFDADPKNRLAMNAVTQNDIAAVALNRAAVSRVDHTYSHLIETPEATSQGATGRCWMFAGLNVLRLAAIEKMEMKMDKFELSQSYLMFWDKLEKANFFLENIIETRDEPLNGRLVMWLLASPISDAGQWDMFVSLVRKYGVVPKTVMPETQSSKASRGMNGTLVAKLREFARTLREMYAEGATVEALREAKGEMLAAIPPDADHPPGQTPVEFCLGVARQGQGFPPARRDHAAGLLRGVRGRGPGRYGLPDQRAHAGQTLQQALHRGLPGQCRRWAARALSQRRHRRTEAGRRGQHRDGQAVWFGSDVGKMMARELGLLDVDAYDYELVYGVPFRSRQGRTAGLWPQPDDARDGADRCRSG